MLAFYYSPDLSAGAFRCAALIEELQKILPHDAEIEIITTLPNRFSSYDVHAAATERQEHVTVRRLKMPDPKGGVKHQARMFAHYSLKTHALVKKTKYDLIFATSSKLFTATLGAYLAGRQGCKLYLDIRDIFADALKDTLPTCVSRFVVPVFSALERWTIKRADHVNLVSLGFQDYFKTRYPQNSLSFYTNGVDKHLQHQLPSDASSCSLKPLKILYAGTLGEGQGLDLILPQLASETKERMHFRIIGEGGRKEKLRHQLQLLGCENVELVAPINREALMDEYQRADVLFLHLNDCEAFQKVLPSKLFEYSATGKPIWAGVAGYAARFVHDEISNAVVFNPGDVTEAINSFEKLALESMTRTIFIEKYSRETIMKKMAEDVLSLARLNSQASTAVNF